VFLRLEEIATAHTGVLRISLTQEMIAPLLRQKGGESAISADLGRRLLPNSFATEHVATPVLTPTTVDPVVISVLQAHVATQNARLPHITVLFKFFLPVQALDISKLIPITGLHSSLLILRPLSRFRSSSLRVRQAEAS